MFYPHGEPSPERDGSGESPLTVDGEEVAHLLHTDDIDANVSEVARLPGVALAPITATDSG